MTFGFWPMLAWAVQFVLEVVGAQFAWRRRIGFLAAYLGFSAFADLITFLILKGFGGNAYGYASWTAEAASYVLLCLLACQLAANMTGDWWAGKGRMSLSAFYTYPGLLSLIGVAILTAIVRNESSWAGKFLDAEIAASCYLCVAILIAWIGHEGRLPRPWGFIMLGILTLVGGNALCAWLRAWQLYPVGEILGLGILVAAGWRNWECEEVRIPLPKKKPPTSVGSPEILEMFGG